MKPRSIVVLVLLWAGATAPMASGCQHILGIHESQVAEGDPDGAAGNAPGGGPAGEGAGGLAGATSFGGSPGAAGSPGGGGAGAGAAGDAGAAGKGGGTGGRSSGMAGARAGAGGSSQPPGGSSGGASSKGGQGGGAVLSGGAGSTACHAPWHAENVQARLLNPPTGMTACSFDGSSLPAMAAGVDTTNFRAAQACGACIRVQPTVGSTSVVVPIVELSGSAGILLTKGAMDQISRGASLINVDWTLVACDVQNQPVQYFIKDGSNAGYVGIQIRNARYPVASVSAVGSKTIALTLQSYNYWESTSVGGGPLSLRLTDINGQSFQDDGIGVVPLAEMVGQGQFPLCH